MTVAADQQRRQTRHHVDNTRRATKRAQRETLAAERKK